MKNNQGGLKGLLEMISIINGRVSISTDEEIIGDTYEIPKDDKARLAKEMTEFMANDENNPYRGMSYYTNTNTIEYNLKINVEDKKKT